MKLGASSFIWAASVGGAKAIPFGAVGEGEHFHFPSTTDVFVKGRGGWYSDASGKKYRTNGKVAVIRITVNKNKND